MITMDMQLLCQACGRPCSTVSLSCAGCQALCYCSTQHMHLHRKHQHGAEECQRMADQLQRAHVLFEHHMPWCAQEAKGLAAWLNSLAPQPGLVQHVCEALRCKQPHHDSATSAVQHSQPCNATVEAAGASTAPDSCLVLPATKQAWQQAWGLPDLSLVPAWLAGPVPTAQSQPVLGWKQYYSLRGLPDKSPAALVLHPVLTLWHCLVNILPSRGWQLPAKGSTIAVAYLGPQTELSQLAAFVELALLLPKHHLHIHFIGPDVPEELHGLMCRVQPEDTAAPQQHFNQGVLQLSCWASCFHDTLADWVHSNEAATSAQQRVLAGQEWVRATAPATGALHLVFAPNAGLPAYPSWLPTLQQLVGVCPNASVQQPPPSRGTSGNGSSTDIGAQDCSIDRSGVPIVFTDYCEEAVYMSAQLVEQMIGNSFSLPCCLNPFRDPVPTTNHGTRLPACSNAFLFGWL